MKHMKPNYKDLLAKRVEAYEKTGVDIKFVPDEKTKDFVGMNTEAARAMGYPITDNTILIDDNLSNRAKYHTLHHELQEKNLMEQGIPYWEAHTKALKDERKIGDADLSAMTGNHRKAPPQTLKAMSHKKQLRQSTKGLRRLGGGLVARTIPDKDITRSPKAKSTKILKIPTFDAGGGIELTRRGKGHIKA